MKSIISSLLVIFLLTFSGNLISQDVAKAMDRVYGLDPILYNGKKYTYFLPPGTGGTQFLISSDYFIGEVTLKDKSFEGITLNYDIYNQQLLLKYADEAGTFNIIEISKAWLESFHLGAMEFKYLKLEDSPRFYQVLGDGRFLILFYWRKDLKLDASYGSGAFDFTPAIRNQFVMIDGKLKPFRNNKSFISLFEPGLTSQIKNYMHKNRINLKKASDNVMTELINYIDNL